MVVTKNENVIWVDVDDTLILHNKPPCYNEYDYGVHVKDPLGLKHIKVWPHYNMLRLLKEEKHRGSYIIVHSRGGWEWALNVVEALELEGLVDEVKTKPLVYFDDKDVTEWLRHRAYLDPNTNYKC